MTFKIRIQYKYNNGITCHFLVFEDAGHYRFREADPMVTIIEPDLQVIV